MDTLESLIERARKAEDQMHLPLVSLLRYMAPDDLHAARQRIADYVLAHADALIARERSEAQRIADYALAQADALITRERTESDARASGGGVTITSLELIVEWGDGLCVVFSTALSAYGVGDCPMGALMNWWDNVEDLYEELLNTPDNSDPRAAQLALLKRLNNVQPDGEVNVGP